MKTDLPTIKGKGFIMDELKESDYLEYYFMTCSFDNTKYLSFGPINSINEARITLNCFYLNRKALGLPNVYAIRKKLGGEMIGIIEYHTYYYNTNCAELGFILREDFHHKGIMHKALKEMIKICFYELNLSKILVSYVDINYASKKLVEDLGFKYESTRYGAFLTHDTNEKRNIIYCSMYKEEYEVMLKDED